MRLYIGNQQELPQVTWFPASDLSSLQVYWHPIVGITYTLVICDIDAPYPSNPINSPFIHLLVVNIPGNMLSKANVLLKYEPPHPPSDSPAHRYQVRLYKQHKVIPITTNVYRLKFPLESFISQNRLELAESYELIVDAKSNQAYIFQENAEPEVTFNSKYPLIKADTDLNEREQAYCECVVDAAAKQPGSCNLEKAWFEHRDGRVCANPYAVCAHSVGTSSRKCDQNYNFDQFTTEQLTALINLKRLNITSDNHESLVTFVKNNWVN